MERGVERNRQSILQDIEPTKKTHSLKVILLGESGVGKSSLIHRFVNDKFQPSNNKRLHFEEPRYKDLQIDGKTITLEIHDTNGREDPGTGGLDISFYNNVKACMFVYDVSDPTTLSSLENWQNMFNNKVNPKESFPFIVLGNKDDIEKFEKKETLQKANEWCQSKGLLHLQTSAKIDLNVLKAFTHVSKLAMRNASPAATSIEDPPSEPFPKENEGSRVEAPPSSQTGDQNRPCCCIM